MHILSFLANIGAGLFLCNSIPHLCAGLRGEAFPSPFAKPPGQGLSSPLTNTFWGTFNLVIGCLLLDAAPFALNANVHSALFFAAFLAIGCGTSTHFEKVRKK